jgi:hypothetical protein
MEIPDNNDLENIGTALQGAQSLSLLKEAEDRRQKREHTLFLDVPSWNGDLIAEYRVVPPDDLRKLAEAALRKSRNGNGDQLPNNDITVIAASCVGLYVKDPETDERVPVEDEYGHVKYDRIAHVLGKDDEIKSSPDAVRYVMGERDKDGDGGWTENIMAMSIHANTIGKWMRDPSKGGVDLEELLGEF